jgi:uncharacterized membrane protein YphA (DoxX/SURF4 family)
MIRRIRKNRLKPEPGAVTAAATLPWGLQFWHAPVPLQITHLGLGETLTAIQPSTCSNPLSLGILLILGLWTRCVAFSAAALLFLFGTSMAISFGLKSPLDYSVFSASAGALLLALNTSRRSE